MSQDDADVVRAMYAAFSTLAQGGDVEAYVATYFDPACEYLPIEETDAVRGHEALVRWNLRWFEAWDVFEAKVERLLESGAAIVASIRVEGRGGASGMVVAQPFFHIIELRDGRITRMRESLEEPEATGG